MRNFLTRSLLKPTVCQVAKMSTPNYVITHKHGHACPHHVQLEEWQAAADQAGGMGGARGARTAPADNRLGLPITEWLTGTATRKQAVL